ncbi:MAG: CRISPR-associated endoribonuclease Cas6 [Candidatus Heimdallarchaeum aukensis]|uniref:CRISPR-associated endoribonuclease Cas6 n=1 Tax=Candidatus Heimdallarchaeum aukensis TaxID=2876573 RepID=A0A9Y1BM59_9ARCH|nr:MAG: CRISPR-associated endoribonuclease Cas6 [Candidatus Heimdallarchaeum aukensis]
MRILISFKPKFDVSEDAIVKHDIQGFIYNLIKYKDTKVLLDHDKHHFKFFCFSDIFPQGDFKKGETKNLLISSPTKELINLIDDNLPLEKSYRLAGLTIEVISKKTFNFPTKNNFISGSPIVLYKDNTKNEYFSFKKHKSLNFFLNRLQENAVKKYQIYYNDPEFQLSGKIFDTIEFRKEVAVHNRKQGNEFIHIGTLWKKLEKEYIKKEERRFYHFIMESGLGEKNSMGFGFLNPIQ